MCCQNVSRGVRLRTIPFSDFGEQQSVAVQWKSRASATPVQTLFEVQLNAAFSLRLQMYIKRSLTQTFDNDRSIAKDP